MLEVCVETLERLPGVVVVAERDPRRAADRLQQEAFDLLISNIQMPRLNGVSLLKQAKAAIPEMPVLMVTGYPMAETAQQCRDLGAAGYLTKPFVPDDLIAAVRVALNL